MTAAKELPTIFLAVSEGERAILEVRYGRNAGARVVRHYSGDVVGRASGGGYDVAGAAMADALANVFGIPEADGVRGMSYVRSEAEAHGVRVFSLGEAMYALPLAGEGDA